MFFSSAPLIHGLTTIFLASKDTQLLRVCTSPGCRDDGALGTLDRLTALAPPSVKVVKGGCLSLCGSGPVVEILDNVDDAASTKRKRVKGDAVVSIMDEFMAENDTEQPRFTSFMRDRLLGGYESFLHANEAFESKNYQSAVELYEEAIQNGRKPAMILQEAREKRATSETESLGYPAGLTWLVQSFRNSCRSRLALGDIDGARRDAFAATVFSQNTDAASQECLADCCKASGDAMGEWQAVKASIESYARLEEKYSQPLPGKDAVARAEAAKIRTDAASRKRELGFRLAKLERELKS
jgi:(2Fe-2S) ferredoxin